jgi:protoporphyrinogen oxidase
MGLNMIAIVGGGPCGLGAAYRLHELGFPDFQLFEAENQMGGLARSFTDQEGFLWDIGGHVQFSHYEDFDRVMDLALPNGWYTHERQSWVWMHQKFIPYPLQLNIHRLPPPVFEKCLVGLKNRQGLPSPQNFEDWLLASFGEGLFECFMKPYNFKVWAHRLSQMDFRWIGERVATVDLDRIEKNRSLDQDDISWGPNAVFRFPKKGGTGAVWEAVAKLIPADKLKTGHRLERIDAKNKVLHFKNGKSQKFSKLLITSPIHKTGEWMGISPASPLLFSNSHIIGVGVEGRLPSFLEKKCWIYFPESNCPFYRATVFSNYSPAHVPDPNIHWSLMCEVSESNEKPVRAEALVDETLRALFEMGFLDSSQKLKSTWHFVAAPGYPTPFLGRDKIVHEWLDEMKKYDIYSRGRFGLWKYEASNQDHTFMQGLEWVDHILFGEKEETAFEAQAVNSRPKTKRRSPKGLGHFCPTR